MKSFEQVKIDLYDAILLIEGLMDTNHYNQSDKQSMRDVISGIQQAINTIYEQLMDGTLPTEDDNQAYKQFLNLSGI